MRQPQSGTTMIALTGSMTGALAAQRALAAAAVRCEVVKEDTGDRGCGWGVTFPSAQYGNVRTILQSAHVAVRRYKPTN